MSKLQVKNSTSSKKFVCTASTDPSTGKISNLSCTELGREKLIHSSCALVEASQDRQCLGKNCDQCSDCVANLVYERIYDDHWPDQTGAIQHQFEWQELFGGSVTKVLEVEKEFRIRVRRIVTGTEPSADSDVYGYNADGSLDLDGGPAKTYDPNFRYFCLRYHGAQEGIYPSDVDGSPVVLPLSFLTASVIKSYYDKILSYFYSRGFSLQGSDRFNKFDDQFIWSYAAGQNQAFTTSGSYVAMKIIWSHRQCKNGPQVPAFIDLHATANFNFSEVFVLDTFEPNASLRQNGHGYPLRIPVTRDFCGTFQRLYNVSPIAFYDRDCHILTIHVPETSNGHFLVRRIVNTGNPDLNVDYEEHLLAFDGSFSLLQKEKCNQLTATGFDDVDMFAQVSETLHIKSRVVSFGETVVPDYEASNPIRAALFSPDLETVHYTGAVIAKMSGGTSSYDVHAIPISVRNAFTFFLDPLQRPEEYDFAQGDNPVTTLIEHYSTPTATTLYDTDWNSITFQLPHSVITAQSSFPENLDTTPPPSRITLIEAGHRAAVHEFVHQSQAISGTIWALPAEGMATGIEMDTRAVGDVFSVARARRFVQVAIRLTRGIFTMMTPELQQFATFGLGMFWKYIQDQFDFNNQVMRRTMDILSSETHGPLLKANDFPDAASFLSSAINPDGGSAALQQSLLELYGRDIKDVWNDFSISMVLLRNNTSIPAQYRSSFPYWIYSSEYTAGYPIIVEGMTADGTARFSDWWEKFDTNGIIPANYGTAAYTGETFVRTLPETFTDSIPNLKTLSFNVPHDANNVPSTITVTITAGEWRLTVVQFTSDGTEVGSWIQDGPHTAFAGDVVVFDIANREEEFTTEGNIRLVCANVTFTATGTTLEDYFQPEADSGTITIVSTR